ACIVPPATTLTQKYMLIYSSWVEIRCFHQLASISLFVEAFSGIHTLIQQDPAPVNLRRDTGFETDCPWGLTCLPAASHSQTSLLPNMRNGLRSPTGRTT